MPAQRESTRASAGPRAGAGLDGKRKRWTTTMDCGPKRDEKMNPVLYFAYGSNLDDAQMRERCAKVLEYWPLVPVTSFADATLADGTAGKAVDRNDLARVKNFRQMETGNPFLYNSGYWQPLGGGTPGPRFLTPALPFLALGLAPAYRRFPALTLGLAIPSAITMLAAALTYPLLGDGGTGTWISWLVDGSLEHTLLTAFGVTNAWLAVLPVLAAVGSAIAFAARATPRTSIGRLRPALYAVFAWSFVSIVGPTIAGDPITPLNHGSPALALVAAATVASVTTLVVLSYRDLRPDRRARQVRAEPRFEQGT